MGGGRGVGYGNLVAASRLHLEQVYGAGGGCWGEPSAFVAPLAVILYLAV